MVDSFLRKETWNHFLPGGADGQGCRAVSEQVTLLAAPAADAETKPLQAAG